MTKVTFPKKTGKARKLSIQEGPWSSSTPPAPDLKQRFSPSVVPRLAVSASSGN